MTLKAWATSRGGAGLVGAATVLAAIALVELLIRAGVINRFIVPLPSQIIAAIPRIVTEENVVHRFWQTTQEVVWASLLLAVVGIASGALLYRFSILRLACESWVGALAAAPIVLMYPLFLVIFGRSATTIVMIGFAAGLAPVILKTVEGLRGTRAVLINVGRSFRLTRSQQFFKILLPAALPSVFVGLKLGLIFAMINIVGVEFLINFGGLGQFINELAERYDLPGTYGAILFVVLASVVFFVLTERLERWVEADRMNGTSAGMSTARRVAVLRIFIVGAILAAWEALAASGWLFRDVVPSLAAIAKAGASLLTTGDFYGNLGVTAAEIAAALVIGGLSGLAVGIFLGANRFAARAYESLIYYLGPTPKIIFFPVMIMWFGVGSGSKIAMGAISCFFPIAINTASGMREIDRVLIDVGQSFRATPWQMVTKVYLPAMREPIVNGVRLGLGVAIIGTLLAETKLSNRGVGYLIIQAYSTFDMPRMYALLIVLFVLAIGANTLIGRMSRSDGSNAT